MLKELCSSSPSTAYYRKCREREFTVLCGLLQLGLGMLRKRYQNGACGCIRAKVSKDLNLIGNGPGMPQIKILGVFWHLLILAHFCVFWRVLRNRAKRAVQQQSKYCILSQMQRAIIYIFLACSNWVLARFENGTKTMHLDAFGPKSPRILI